eukprot:s3374_g8.t1
MEIRTQESPGKEASYFEREAEELKEIKASGTNMAMGQNEAFTSFTQFRTGAVYKGEWKDGMRHGVGHQTWPDGATYSGQYGCSVG